jgi:predicted ABC-type ATPase
MMGSRPILVVLAGANGAGKSSIGGALLEDAGTSWYNPDRWAKEYLKLNNVSQEQANSLAWHRGVDLLKSAIDRGEPYAVETTLRGKSVAAEIRRACDTHDVHLWYCGLATLEMHIQRVKEREAAGGHGIPEDKVREAWQNSRLNLVKLMPFLSALQVYDNSAEADADGVIPSPRLLLQMKDGRLSYPMDSDIILSTPPWAQPLLEHAMRLSGL